MDDMQINQNNVNGPNVVNVGLIPRKLNAYLKQELLKLLPSTSKKIKIFSVNGDSDSQHYAQETRAFLISEGYMDVDDIISATYYPAQIGESVIDRGDYIEITIGQR